MGEVMGARREVRGGFGREEVELGGKFLLVRWGLYVCLTRDMSEESEKEKKEKNLIIKMDSPVRSTVANERDTPVVWIIELN